LLDYSAHTVQQQFICIFSDIFLSVRMSHALHLLEIGHM